MGPQEKKAFAKGFQAGADSVEEGLPGWFGTFADMMTLLFAFFVLLAAISTMDPVKLQEMANSEGKSLGSEIEAEGAEVQTVEGIGSNDSLHVIQEKFLEHAALQCGICTPGLIVSVKALLEENPDPTEEEARYYLAGNLCRCTGYDKIIRAVLDAAQTMKEERAI